MDKAREILSQLKNHMQYAAGSPVGVLLCALVILVVLGQQTGGDPVTGPRSVQPAVTEPVTSTVATDTLVVSATSDTRPTRLIVPRAQVDSTFVDPLGLLDSGEVAVPATYDQVGWYRYSPVPGNLGPSVILGHVDSVGGPAVFFSLGQLQTGDEVIVERDDGVSLVYAVTRNERYDQNDFPTDLVYQDIDHAGLRLITCSGIFDQGTQRYSHNRVVFAELVGTREST